ncbi:MAG TPA: hypothetical protein PKE19_00100 [Aestuariivirga sp.]|nr:hypothetical protein [Aestuariivirga sp.]
MSSCIITGKSETFILHGEGFTSFPTDFDMIADTVTDKLLEVDDTGTLSEEDLIGIGDRACWTVVKDWHDPNAVTVALVRA